MKALPKRTQGRDAQFFAAPGKPSSSSPKTQPVCPLRLDMSLSRTQTNPANHTFDKCAGPSMSESPYRFLNRSRLQQTTLRCRIYIHIYRLTGTALRGLNSSSRPRRDQRWPMLCDSANCVHFSEGKFLGPHHQEEALL